MEDREVGRIYEVVRPEGDEKKPKRKIGDMLVILLASWIVGFLLIGFFGNYMGDFLVGSLGIIGLVASIIGLLSCFSSREGKAVDGDEDIMRVPSTSLDERDELYGYYREH